MRTDVLTQKEHHLYGGSSAKFWSQCYGWASATQNLPPSEPGKPALIGTALHTGILERKVRAEIDHRVHGTSVNISYHDIPDWPIEGEEIANAFWINVWVHVLEEIITGKMIYIERKLMLFPDKDSGGTADLVVIYKNDKSQVVCTVIELKTGWHRIEPSDEQLLFYLCAANERAKEKGLKIDVFNSAVYQPSHSEPFTTHTFTGKKIQVATKKYEKAIAESRKQNPKFKAGEHCRYCKAQAVCKTYNKYLSERMDLEVQDKVLPSVESLSDEKLVQLFMYGERIEEYISAVRKHIIQRFANQKPLPGLKLVAGVAKRRWKDEQVAETVLRMAGVEPMVPKIIGITTAESMLRAAGKSSKEVAAIMYTITEKPQPHPKVTVETDKRPALLLESGVSLLEGLDYIDEVI